MDIFHAAASTVRDVLSSVLRSKIGKPRFSAAFECNLGMIPEHNCEPFGDIVKHGIRCLESTAVKNWKSRTGKPLPHMRIVIEYGNPDTGNPKTAGEEVAKRIFHVGKAVRGRDNRVASEDNMVCRKSGTDD